MARRRRHTRAFKLDAIARMETAPDVSALAASLGVAPGLLYKWNKVYRLGGEAALRLPGERPGQGLCEREACTPTELGVAQRTIELERKVAQQALELDFFRAALRRFRARQQESGGPGGTRSTP